MTQEEKELLLKDLCARLPYGTKCLCKWTKDAPNGTSGCIQELSTFVIDEIEIMDNPQYECQICDVKPYLRSMSSMTEEERKEYDDLFYIHSDGEAYCENWEWMDWMNAHHFDYRGLIEKGLAIEVTKENNPYV